MEATRMKMKITLILAAAVSLFFLAGCGILDDVTAPKETTTARPTVRVTVPEGYTVYQIAMLLEEKGVCPAQDFIDAVNNPPADNAFAAEIKNGKDRPFLLEGYVFPDTYDFYVGEPAARALGRFLSNTKSKLTDEDYARAEELGYTMDEILTIASIIQKEAGLPSEDKKVSSVLHKRLNSKNFPRLQFDVTIHYLNNLADNHDPNAREKYDDLYNTYVCKGLPAGPIANPGRTSINAALYPADTDYYYFFTYAGLNFYYSTNFAEHSREYNIRKNWTTPTG